MATCEDPKLANITHWEHQETSFIFISSTQVFSVPPPLVSSLHQQTISFTYSLGHMFAIILTLKGFNIHSKLISKSLRLPATLTKYPYFTANWSPHPHSTAFISWHFHFFNPWPRAFHHSVPSILFLLTLYEVHWNVFLKTKQIPVSKSNFANTS